MDNERTEVDYIWSLTPREGCAKYRFYDKQGNVAYAYCNYDPRQKNITGTVLKVLMTITGVPLALMVVTLPIVFLYLWLWHRIDRRKYIPTAVMVEDKYGNVIEGAVEKIKHIRCAYCGGTYDAKELYACPHCNAPVTHTDGVHS